MQQSAVFGADIRLQGRKPGLKFFDTSLLVLEVFRDTPDGGEQHPVGVDPVDAGVARLMARVFVQPPTRPEGIRWGD